VEVVGFEPTSEELHLTLLHL